MNVGTYIYTGSLILAGLCSHLATAVTFPLSMGKQTSENTYKSSLRVVYENDFEETSDLFALNSGATYSTDVTKVLSGTRSVRLASFSTLQIPLSELSLPPGGTYVAQIDYASEAATVPANSTLVQVGFTWPGFAEGFSSARHPAYPSAGTYQHSMSLPASETNATLEMRTQEQSMRIDKIRIFLLVPELHPAEPFVLKYGFPRLSNFQVFSTSTLAETLNEDVKNIRDQLARFDFVNGISVEHTFGDQVDYLYLKSRNPDILLLPYQQTFLSVLIDTAPPIGGSAGLLRQYSQGLEDDWFLKNPEGEQLFELLYPDNFQMNSTRFCPEVDGVSFNDYQVRFVEESILPTGYWSGIHFDQTEWFPNPLLAEIDPFNNQSSAVVEMDLDNDGESETVQEIYIETYNGFIDFFSQLNRTLSPSTLLFGNAGEMSKNEPVLQLLNGFQYEYFSPYRSNPDGSYDTSAPSFWYRYLAIHQHARGLLRAPQVPSTQMTGAGLGTPSGTNTINGVPDRLPVLTTADYDRMRFGLASTLMTDGFFGYDFVDNSTLPFAWLDEYAVDLNTGTPDLTQTHYLGQPLGDAQELSYAQTSLVEIDFEGGLPTSLPINFSLGSNLVYTEDPNEVLEGTGSAKISFDYDPENPSSEILFASTTAFLPNINTTYQVFMDYRILDYAGERFDSFFNTGFFGPELKGDRFENTVMWYRDVSIGQTGQVRAVFHQTTVGQSVLGLLSDTGTIVIDNIRIIEGTGGIYRRDFENGVVLVNPTPHAKIITASEMSGSLSRTGLRRIQGSQVPAINSGAVITNDLVISSGDAIILLADTIKSDPPTTPTPLPSIVISDNEIFLQWEASTGTVSGYQINYGLSFGDLTRFKMIGKRQNVLISDLEPGRAYDFTISAYDYEGNFSDASTAIRVITSGVGPSTIPIFVSIGQITPGSTLTLQGSNLSNTTQVFSPGTEPFTAGDTQVLINGIIVPLTAVSPNEVTVITPGNLGGTQAIVRVEKSGITSPSSYTPILEQTTDSLNLFYSGINPSKDTFNISWNSKSLTNYQLRSSTDLLEWYPVGEPIQALTGYTEVAAPIDTTSLPNLFFKIYVDQ